MTPWPGRKDGCKELLYQIDGIITQQSTTRADVHSRAAVSLRVSSFLWIAHFLKRVGRKYNALQFVERAVKVLALMRDDLGNVMTAALNAFIALLEG